VIDKQKIIGLIPAKAMGCLTVEDNLIIQSYLDEGYEFPWDELANYQYTAALLPLALQLEIPEPSLKDNVALKLIKLTEEQLAKKIREEEQLTLNKMEEETSTFSDDNILPDEPAEHQVPVEENEISTSFNLDEIDLPEADAPEPFILGTTPEPEQEPDNFSSEENPENTFSVDETDLSQETIFTGQPIVTSVSEETPIVNNEESKISSEETTEEKIIEENVEAKEISTTDLAPQVEERRTIDNSVANSKFGEIQKKTQNEKIFKALEQELDLLKSGFTESEKKLTRNLLMAYVAIAILLALLIFSYFKFTADIKVLEKGVNDVKRNTTSELMEKKIIESNFYFLS
jgi:hypothetical protein